MKKIIHLSDLHFGTEREGIVEVLIETINHLNPDMIIVSGDLTQRARYPQFRSTKRFLQKLTCPHVLSVPGNHDISLYNLIERIFYPFRKYNRVIRPEFPSQIITEKFAIFGINSVTPFKPMGGFVTQAQLDNVSKFFFNMPSTMVKIVVMHHNLIRSERHKIINDSEKIINTFAASNINLVLSGHIHEAHIEKLKRNYLAHNMYIITAGTPISYRTTDPNSFNLIEFNNVSFTLNVFEYKQNQFREIGSTKFSL